MSTNEHGIAALELFDLLKGDKQLVDDLIRVHDDDALAALAEVKNAREAILDEGRHLHDLAVARGIDQERYFLHRNRHGQMALFRGPRFHDVEPDGWFQERLDQYVLEGDPDV